MLTVTVPATSRWLVTLADLKVRLGITGSGDDAELARVIRARSEAIYGWCGVAADQLGRRTLVRETMTVELLRDGDGRGTTIRLPWRIPVGAVSNIVEDGATLLETQYRVHAMTALVERIDPDRSAPCCWSAGPVTITYQAGWLPADAEDPATDLPADLQDAALQECAAAWRGRRRDPGLRSEDVPDVYSYTVAFGQGGTRDTLLPETESVLREGGYRVWPT